MADEPEIIEEVDVAELSEWTTGYSEEAGAVALVLQTSDGQRFSVAMPPEMADQMGAALKQVASRFNLGSGPSDA